MNKVILKMVLLRFAKVWLASFVVLIPAVPQNLIDLKEYAIKVGIAAIIGVLVATDKLIRELAKE